MKITGPDKSSETGKSKKSDGVSKSGDGTFQSMVSGGADSAKGTTQSSVSSSIASVDALLMAQSTEDPAQKKAQKRMRARADNLLEKLNDLKVAILTGNVSVGHMVSIADVAAIHREKITDPELSALLDEIDLRAQIELAKIEVSQSRV